MMQKSILCVSLLVVAVHAAQAQDGPQEPFMSICKSKLRIAGVAAGGSVSIGHVWNSNLLTVETVAGETAVQVVAKLVQAFKDDPESAPFPLQTTDAGEALLITNTFAGTVFLRTTDTGLTTIGSAQDLTASANKPDMKVCLSWTLPSAAPATIFVQRDGVILATLAGTATTYDDTAFGEGASPMNRTTDRTTAYALLCGGELEEESPTMFSDITRVTADNPEFMPDDIFRIITGELTLPLPGGVVGTPYSATLHKNDGTNPVSWSLSVGTLPLGLSLSSDGSISGTPAQTGSWSFTVAVTDATGASATKQLSIDVTQYPLLTGTINE